MEWKDVVIAVIILVLCKYGERSKTAVQAVRREGGRWWQAQGSGLHHGAPEAETAAGPPGQHRGAEQEEEPLPEAHPGRGVEGREGGAQAEAVRHEAGGGEQQEGGAREEEGGAREEEANAAAVPSVAPRRSTRSTKGKKGK